ncbi:uncharacterized membrane protein YhaH (DUF805 family) [Paucimonas lemoignei]|uniref:Uncharacterized membrane protein YhaH (DUF805 family) n=1 Tax=Paucimonas lemoignei TaxID=29443 RepID=A0A4R3HWM5_PAULE|nr:DUF805 domain-containing protein [Paucimonas lemoignei]TCS37538.1 uncharacterized membrane protein YhaH (DUF805 family) [Paucimonas lemoignei]
MNTSNIVEPVVQRRRLWTLHGRLGRAEYIVYSLGAVVLVCLAMILVGLFALLAGGAGRMVYGIVTVFLIYCLLPVFFTMLTVRRAHDFNCGGWLALFLLVPVINLAFWFIPGTRGENRYGAAPQMPSNGMKLVAILLPTLMIGGFLATGVNLADGQARSIVEPANSLKPYQP